jgi:hypothetical protein
MDNCSILLALGFDPSKDTAMKSIARNWHGCGLAWQRGEARGWRRGFRLA